MVFFCIWLYIITMSTIKKLTNCQAIMFTCSYMYVIPMSVKSPRWYWFVFDFTSYPCQLLKNLQIVKTLCLHVHICMSSQCHYFPCCPFCTTLYDAPYKFKSRLSLSVFLSKDSFFCFKFLLHLYYFVGKMMIFLFFYKNSYNIEIFFWNFWGLQACQLCASTLFSYP
jgi:hypothetical protein